MFTKVLKNGITAILIVSMLGMGTRTYIPTAYAESTDIIQEQEISNLLSKLEIEGVQLDKDFTASVNEYSATVEYEVENINVLVESGNPDSLVTINGEPMKNGNTNSLSLQTGKNVFLIAVKDTSDLTNTYTLTVTRKEIANNPSQNIEPAEPVKPVQQAEPIEQSVVNSAIPIQSSRTNSIQSAAQIETSTEVQKTSKATLSSLSVSDGTWDSSFSSSEYTYHVKVSNDTKTITIKPTASYSSSTILIEGSSSKTIQLEDDPKTIISVVVSNGDDDRKTYVVVIDKIE
ncbi:cadherin-like beta sandwich domain-containing protein [Neobacillus sp. OS1-2]|uniref:cadherin-like beta sandwich domain-containing protein n=1 Tax=Neobacillus sp. OS1-2 TaxID=3070680 RepID=UPI0027E0DDE1|nr:cadherin-like beta sandwich domain-containing protein [Neobacillus sp. OS1-2]WML38854.1 cadherin-like beta sandwich domain-containing protein [Neobacillus sp. OS1-2]